MKRVLTTLTLSMFALFACFGQAAFAPEYVSGQIKLINLSNPSNFTVIGTGPAHIGACDFGADGYFYGLTADNSNLYKIDTSTAAYTLIAHVPPPGSEYWTGMALDPTDGQMYICSTDGFNTSFFILNVVTGDKTLVGSNQNDDGAVGIAFDDSGQMYAIYLVRKFYKINKTNGSATFVGNFTSACTSGTWHGLDFCTQNQTMYMTSYNSFTLDNQLWTVNLSTGTNYLVGSVGDWTASLAVRPVTPLIAEFTADTTALCLNQSVAFHDLSTGNPVSWYWSFEGGTPYSSTQKNPVITYNTITGQLKVSLTVINATDTSTIEKQDYMNVVICSGVENTDQSGALHVRPNPFTDHLEISADDRLPGLNAYSISDYLGRTVLSGSFNTRELNIDTKDLIPGLYVLIVSGPGGRIMNKILKI